MNLPENDYHILKLTDEFNETMVNLERIKKEALDFVEDYCNLTEYMTKRTF